MDLETCKRKLIDELLAHEKDDLKKSCAYQIDRIISKSRGFSVGTVRVWNGQKHRKVAPGKWVPVYDGDGRAASQSAAHVARQIKNANDFKELGEIVSQNLRRFTVGGKLLPVAQAVLEAAKKRQGELKGNSGGKRLYATRDGVVPEEERREQVKAANEADKKLLDDLDTTEERKRLIYAYIRQASGDMETRRDKLHALCKEGAADRIMDKIAAGYRPMKSGRGRNLHYHFEGHYEDGRAFDGGPIDKDVAEFAMTLWKNKDKGMVMDMLKAPKAVQHDGEYVLTRSGSKDFGEITPELSREIKRQAGKIRLRTGKEEKGAKDNYGEKHIERDSRMKQIASAGFNNARDFIEYVCSDFDAVYNNGMGLILARKGKDKSQIAMIELTPSGEGDYYDVKTGLVSRNTYLNTKKPLWEKSESGSKGDIGTRRVPVQNEPPSASSGQPKSSSERAQSNQSESGSPLRGLAGEPDSSTIPHSPDSVKRQLLETFERNGVGNGRDESYSEETKKFIKDQVKEAIEKKDVDALYYMLKSKDRYMNARFAVQYARDCFNEMEGENGISFPRAHWTSWKYEESDLKGALKKWADGKKAENKKTKKSCAERINALKKAVFAGMGETA